MRYNTRNPILTKDYNESYGFEVSEQATFSGIASKTGALLLIIFAVAGAIWLNVDALMPYMGVLLIGSLIVSFVSVMIASFSKRVGPFFTVVYAVAEGVLLGSLSYAVHLFYPAANIIPTAVMITFAIFGFLLFTYATGIFKVGFAFRKFVYAATFGVFIFMMISMVFSFVGVDVLGGLAGNSNFALLFYGGLILLASFNLLIDFDNAKRSVEYGAPKKAEWILSLGLIVTLVWLYINIVRFLLILASRARD